MKEMIRFVGFSWMAALTICILYFSLSGEGAYVYYYEPNPLVFIGEVVFSIFSLGVFTEYVHSLKER